VSLEIVPFDRRHKLTISSCYPSIVYPYLVYIPVVRYSKSKIASFYRASYAKRGLGSRNSVCPSVCLSVCPSHACFLTNPKKPTGDIFIPHERAIILVF